MKTKLEKRLEASKKLNREIWKSLRIDQAITTYGFATVKSALNNWIYYQRKNAKLLKEQRQLELKLAEIKKKL